MKFLAQMRNKECVLVCVFKLENHKSLPKCYSVNLYDRYQIKTESISDYYSIVRDVTEVMWTCTNHKEQFPEIIEERGVGKLIYI